MYLDLKDEVNTLCEGIIPRIEWQIEPDGKQPEELVRTTSLGYSHFNVQALSVLLKIAKNSGKEYWKYSSPDGRSLKKAVDFLYPFAKGDEEWKFEQIKEPSKEDMAICYFYAYYFWDEKKYLDLAKQLTGGEAHKLLLPVTLVETLPQ
jgi:hypothetical protein